MAPLLSVIVPFYDVERYVVACLESLQRQTMTDVEVVLVDDGSTDGSRGLVDTFCAGDWRFRVVQQSNEGLGPARNTGVRAATGTYLTFVDSDDLVPRHAYEHLVGSLERTGSDFAAGDARRFNDLGVRDSYVHRIPFKEHRGRTHVLEFPELALDRMAWNKVYRRSFFDAEDLKFPAMLYEDFPVSIKAHVRARAVDVIKAPVYYWRERDGGELSITQRQWELSNLQDRVSSAHAVLDLLHAEAPSLLPVVEGHLLHIDVSAIAAALHQNDPAEHRAIFDLAHSVVSRCSEESRRALIPFERVQNHLLEQRDLEGLRTLVEYRTEHGTVAAATLQRKGLRRRWYLELPFFEDARVPQELYLVDTDDVTLTSRVLDAAWDGDDVIVDAVIGIRYVSLDEQSKAEFWMEEESGRRVPVSFERSRTQREEFRHDLSRFRLRLEPSRLVDADGRMSSTLWTLRARLSRAGVSVEDSVRGGRNLGRARMSEQHVLGSGLWAQLQARPGGLGVRLRQDRNVVSACSADGGRFVLRGWYVSDRPTEPGPGAPMLRLRLGEGLVRYFPAQLPTQPSPVRAGAQEFEVTVPFDSLLGRGEFDDPVEELLNWEACLVADGKERLLVMSPDCPDASVVRHSRRLQASRTLFGNLAFLESYASPLATRVVWSDEGRLLVSGDLPAGLADSDHLLLRRYVTPQDRVDVSVQLNASDGLFESGIDARELIAGADAVLSGRYVRPEQLTPWMVLLPGQPGLVPVVAARGAISTMPGPRDVDGRDVAVVFGRGERLEVSIP